MPDFPARGVEIARALLAQQPTALPGDDDSSRVFIKRVAEQMAWELGPAYGLKTAGPGRPQGPSQIAFTGADQFGGWRLIDGGTRILDNPPWQNFAGQLFLAVDPIDHLKVSETRPPPRVDPPPPDIVAMVQPLLARVDALETRVAMLSDRVVSIDHAVDDAAHRPYPRYVAKFWGITIVSVPEGS